MHNNIMAAGSKDRPPMLGPGRYSQWRSRFLRYLDTKSNVAAHEEAETIHNMTAENRLYFLAEKEAIFLILTGIGDEIYSTVECMQSQESKEWDPVTTCKFTNAIESSISSTTQPEWTRFVTVVQGREQEIDTDSYHKLFDVSEAVSKTKNESDLRD
ncbi:hypothetical protein Tco_0320026 [Tanacetum coccineum]